MAYLDNNGVTYLWNKIKALFNKGITNLSVNGEPSRTQRAMERPTLLLRRIQTRLTVILREQPQAQTAGVV